MVRIGGDFVHYRYLAFPVLVLIASLGGIVEQFLGSPSRLRAAGVSVAGVAFIGFIVRSYPVAQLPAHRPRAFWPDARQILRRWPRIYALKR